MKTRFTFFTILIATVAQAQVASIDYFGKNPPDVAALFGEGIISTDAFEHSSPSFSPDGKSVLWSIVELPSYKAKVLESKFKNGKWSAPKPAFFRDSTSSDISPSFSPDGMFIYFSSSRKLPSGTMNRKGNVLWRIEKKSSGWSTPEPLDTLISRGGDYAPSISSNNTLYFTHGPFRSPDWNIKVANLHLKTLSANPASFNSTDYEDGAFVAPDESFVIFESNRAGVIDKSIDLFITFRTPDGGWTSPVNMGEKVNTKASERFASISPDGKILFFGSDRRVVNGKPNFDIYWIDASFLKELKKQILK